MPNWVTTKCTVSGPAADIEAIRDQMLNTGSNGKPFFDFERIIPMPDNIFKGAMTLDEQRATAGLNWYDWSIANWGTKWNSCDYEEVESAPGLWVFRMDTAWAFPKPVFSALAKKYSSVLFNVAYFDEGWNFAGRGTYEGTFGGAHHVDATAELYTEVYDRAPETD